MTSWHQSAPGSPTGTKTQKALHLTQDCRPDPRQLRLTASGSTTQDTRQLMRPRLSRVSAARSGGSATRFGTRPADQRPRTSLPTGHPVLVGWPVIFRNRSRYPDRPKSHTPETMCRDAFYLSPVRSGSYRLPLNHQSGSLSTHRFLYTSPRSRRPSRRRTRCARSPNRYCARVRTRSHRAT